MTLEAGKEMDRRCVMNWLMEVYRNPTVAFNTHSDEQQIEFAHDAIVLLKEQEARVLTLDEAVDGTQVYYVEFQYHLDRGWVKCDFDRMYVDGEVAMLFLRNKTFYQQREDYGQLWRLWDKRPTEEQMEAVKWNE